MEFDEIAFEVRPIEGGSVGVISLDRPKQLNPISGRAGGTRDQILHALSLAADDPTVGCVIVRGKGRAFCGGGDLTGNARRETLAEHRDFLQTAADFHQQVKDFALPTIAVVHGFCLGAGVLLAASCDLVIAARSARFGFPEGRMGLVGASVLAPMIGAQWAKFLMLTGEQITAEQAQSLGLVLSLEDEDELEDRVLDLAARITRMPRVGVISNLAAIDGVLTAAGEAAAVAASVELDAATLAVSDRATAPDGRSFRSIVADEGIEGLKHARAAQYTEPWLRIGD